MLCFTYMKMSKYMFAFMRRTDLHVFPCSYFFCTNIHRHINLCTFKFF